MDKNTKSVFKNLLVLTLVFLQLWGGFLTTAFASQPPEIITPPLPSMPPDPVLAYHVNVYVQAPDPNNPGQFIPVPGMQVALHTPDNEWYNPELITTNSNGVAQFTVLNEGLVAAYLPPPEDPDQAPWAGYRVDEHAQYAFVGGQASSFNLTLTLEPRPAPDGTGGVRLQKIFYPYPFGFETQNGVLNNLFEFEGPHVTGAEFIVTNYTGHDQPPPNIWLGNDGNLTATMENARKFVTGADGQVLIDGLVPGQYIVYEIAAPFGQPLDELRAIDFSIIAHQVGFVSTPFPNFMASFSVLFEKVDEQTLEPLAGAEFVVFRLNSAGNREYLRYAVEPLRYSPVLPSYTLDPAQAYVFKSNTHDLINENAGDYWMYAKGRFVVPGLEPGTTYYLSEVTPPVGYLPGTDLAFSEANKIDVLTSSEEPQPIRVSNVRQPGVAVFNKYLDFNLNDTEDLTMPLPGALFVLGKVEMTVVNGNTVPMVTMVNSGGTQPDEPPVFSQQTIDIVSAWDEFILTLPETYDWNKQYQDFFAQYNAQIYTSLNPSGDIPIYGLPENSNGQTYFLMEISAPAGVSIDSGVVFEMVDGQPVPLPEYSNTENPTGLSNALKSGTLMVSKTDLSGTKPLPGADFRIFIRTRGEDGAYTQLYLTAPPTTPTEADPEPALPLGQPDDVENAHIFTTDESGRLYVADLPALDDQDRVIMYYLEEVASPPGYLMDGGDWHSFQFSNWNRFYTINIRNIRIPPVPVNLPASKQVVDLEGNTLPIGDFPPFTFEVSYKDEVIGIVHHDESGKLIFDNIWIDTSTLTQEELSEPVYITLRELVPEPPLPGMIYDTRIYVVPAEFRGPMIGYSTNNPGVSRTLPKPQALRTVYRADGEALAIDDGVARGGDVIAAPMQGGTTTLGGAAIALMFLSGLEFQLPFVNVYNLTEPFLVEKRFVGEEYDGDITINLLQKNLSGEYVHYNSAVVNGEIDPETVGNTDTSGEFEPWKYRWVGLPSHIQSYDAQTGITTLIPTDYRYEEHQTPEGYESSIVMDESGNYLINNSRPGTVIARKDWGVGTPVGSLKFQLYQVVLETEAERPFGTEVTLDGVADAVGDGAGELEGWRYRWTGLPVDATVNGVYESYKYIVKESSPPPGFVWDTATSSSLHIVNRLATTTPDPGETETPPPEWTDPPVPDYPPISVAFSARKELHGGRLSAGDFHFVLKDRAGNVLETVDNRADGSVSFSPRRFSRTGTFLYTIEEIKGTQAGMVYDSTVHTVRVEVTALNGSLSAQVTYLKGSTPHAEEPIFINRQTPPSTGDSVIRNILFAGFGALALFGGVALVGRKRRKTL